MTNKQREINKTRGVVPGCNLFSAQLLPTQRAEARATVGDQGGIISGRACSKMVEINDDFHAKRIDWNEYQNRIRKL